MVEELARRGVAFTPVVTDSDLCEIPNAATVAESAWPVACRPFASWNLRSAASVRGPTFPSTGPGLKPFRFRVCCIERTTDGSFMSAIDELSLTPVLEGVALLETLEGRLVSRFPA